VRRRIQIRGNKPLLAAVALLAISFSWAAPQPVRAIPGTAQRFFCYLHAMDRSGQKLSFWDKVTYSLVLSSLNGSAENKRAGT
jgi:hypothetical protein